MSNRGWRNRAAGVTVTAGLVLGVADTFRPREAPAIVIDYPADDPIDDGIVLFFHPQVPEATLVLVR